MKYSILLHPVTRNISAVQKLLLKVLGPGQEKKVKLLVQKGGTILENLNKEAATNFANQLRELGAQVEVVEIEEDDSGDTYRAYQVQLVDAGKNTRAVVKLVREVTGLGLKEAKELATRGGTVLENLNKRAAGNFANQLKELGAQVEIVEMKEDDSGDANPSFEVRLIDAGKNEAEVIVVIRELTKLSLKEAKAIVHRLGVVVENLSKKEGGKVKAKLEAAGAKARIEEMSSPEPEPDEPQPDVEDCNIVYGNLTDKNGQHLAKFSITICDATIQKWLSLVDRFTDKETSDFMSHKSKAKKKYTKYKNL